MKSKPSKALIDAVNGPLMMEHMQEFAKWRKESGVPEELKSLDYVEKRMKEYGFATQLILHDAYISLPGKASVKAPDGAIRCITHSFSRSAPKGGLTAEVVDLDAGSPADFAKHDVRGKIVLVDGIANPVLSRRASQAGAAGQLHVSPHEHVHEMCISPVWGSPTTETVGNLPSTVVVTVPREGGDSLRAQLAGNPSLKVTIEAEVDTRWRKTPILVCDMAGPGGDVDEPFVFFTGHHDTWYYGSDGQWRRQRHHDRSRADLRQASRRMEAWPAHRLLVGSLAGALLRLVLVCRTELGKSSKDPPSCMSTSIPPAARGTRSLPTRLRRPSSATLLVRRSANRAGKNLPTAG
jgi:hypothetical protein